MSTTHYVGKCSLCPILLLHMITPATSAAGFTATAVLENTSSADVMSDSDLWGT